MQMITVKGFIGFMCGVVFDIFVFILLRSKFSTELLDMVLIVTPIIFAICGLLTELPEYAEKKTQDQKSNILWIHILALLLAILMAIVLLTMNILQGTFGVVLMIAVTFLIVEGLFRPGIICRWNGIAAVSTTMFVVPVFSLYITLLIQSLLILCLIGVVGFVLLVQSY